MAHFDFVIFNDAMPIKYFGRISVDKTRFLAACMDQLQRPEGGAHCLLKDPGTAPG